MSNNDFFRLSKALKAAGQTGLRNELNKGCRRAGLPLVKVARDRAGEVFPKRGGLAAREALVPFRVVTSTGRDPGVKIVAPGKYVVAKTTNARGQFRHPVFGDKRSGQTRWVTQRLNNAGWFDQAMVRQAPKIRVEIEKAIEAVAVQIVRGSK